VPVSLHVIVLLPTVWAIGLSQQVDQLQGLTSAQVRSVVQPVRSCGAEYARLE